MLTIAPPAWSMRGDLRAHRVEDAGEVHIDDLAPPLDSHCRDDVELTTDPYVVAGDVERAEPVDCGPRQCLVVVRARCVSCSLCVPIA